MIREQKNTSRRQDAHNGAKIGNSEAEITGIIEGNLREFAVACAGNGLAFQSKQHGVRYCCLFMQGSNYRRLCPYAEEKTVHISEKGMDMMRYKCGYEG